MQNLLQVPFSFHRQWLYRYPKYVLFHYDGNKNFIRVRKHGGKYFFADGLKEFRRAHDLNENVILHCVVSDKNTTFSVHVIGPTQRQLCVKPLISKRRYIFTTDVTKSFDDNKDDDKKLKSQEHFMITKMMISRIKE